MGLFVNLIGATINSKRALTLEDDADGQLKFHYPSIAGGPSMFEQVQTTFHAGDGLRIHIGDTSCESNQTCHRVWYSKIEKIGASNQTRIFHHIHATPIDYDFRSNSTNTTSSRRRSSTVHNADDSITEKSGDKLYGGYVIPRLKSLKVKGPCYAPKYTS
jgi:hypothetical protein